ncbi:hypothetical protein FE257_001028 [Aspergillus nanangensis]|uniref:Uncharacterized protein n=1 Tax=Aspergillus nanangensis TaxID=2582783 RepID=A0AAD4CU69_ASPNN|nr:hypothetical protein FE257_001028 [Aspergillus nanangensis]
MKLQVVLVTLYLMLLGFAEAIPLLQRPLFSNLEKDLSLGSSDLDILGQGIDSFEGEDGQFNQLQTDLDDFISQLNEAAPYALNPEPKFSTQENSILKDRFNNFGNQLTGVSSGFFRKL